MKEALGLNDNKPTLSYYWHISGLVQEKWKSMDIYLYIYITKLHKWNISYTHSVAGLVQERHNSIANALELCLSCTHPSIDMHTYIQWGLAHVYIHSKWILTPLCRCSDICAHEYTYCRETGNIPANIYHMLLLILPLFATRPPPPRPQCVKHVTITQIYWNHP